MSGELIALDADGVLVDYHEGYARAWERAFGERPRVRNPNGYHPMHYWDVPPLSAADQAHLWSRGWTEEMWESLPAMPGAVQACARLKDAGATLVCVTALDPAFERARMRNLHNLGMGIERVYAVGGSLARNPKRARLTALAPAAFVDDCLPYLQDLPSGTWRALVVGRPDFSPNERDDLQAPSSRHASLLEFANLWTRAHPNK